MGDATIVGSQWKMVHVGRILYIPTNVSHPDAGKIATIVEIVDHKRVSRRQTLQCPHLQQT